MSNEIEKARAEGVRTALALLRYLNNSGRDMKFAREVVRLRNLGLSQRETGRVLDVGLGAVRGAESALRKCGVRFNAAPGRRAQSAFGFVDLV